MTDVRQLLIDGFGCLRSAKEPFCFERERINLFLDDNEAGKTTLQTALVASLYGVESDRRLLRARDGVRLLRPSHDHWFPLAGPPFGTRIRLHDGDRLLEVQWDFANGGTVRVIDLDTNGDVTGEVCPGGDGFELGRRLLGLSFQEFAKTCLVRHDELHRVRTPKGLVALVERAADSQAGDTTVARALEKLHGLLRQYPGVMLKGGGLIDNEIRRLEEDAEQLRVKIKELEAARAAIADEDREFQSLADERNALRGEATRLEYLAQIAEHDELAARIKAAEERRAALARLQDERGRFADLERFPADRAEQLTQWQAERLGLLREGEQAERRIAELRQHALDPARRDLDATGRIAEATQDEVDDISELLGRTRDFEAREQRLQESIEREEAQLADQGASIEELDRLEARFAVLEPEDGEFLIDQERAEAQVASGLEEARRLALEARLRMHQVKDARQRGREAAHRAQMSGALVGGGAVVAGGLLAGLGAVAGLWMLVVGLLILAGGLAAGLTLYRRGKQAEADAETLQDDEMARATAELGQLGRRQEELAAAQAEREARLKALARRFGYEQTEVLIEDYGSLDDLRRLCGTLIHRRGQVGEMARERETIEAEVGPRLGAYGVDRRPETALSTALEDLQARMARARGLRQKIDELSRKLADDTERHDALRQRAEALTAQIRAVLGEAGLGGAESIEAGLDLFARRAQDFQRLRRLADELIPEAAAAVVDPALVERWKGDLDRFHRSIATQREERPSLVSVVSSEPSTEYRRQAAEVRARHDEVKARADELGHHVVDVLARCQAERPELEEKLAEREAQLARARRHKTAIEAAITVLEEIGREVHGRWAEELNHRTSQLLERVVPTLSNLKFDSRLQFGVWHRGGETPVPSTEDSPILSAGTWDQLYFAVRLGLAEFVAKRRDGGLLLLDDPFAHFDDERFARAIHVLAELTRGRHQVVLFSCQRQRFRWLRERDRKWYDGYIVEQSIAEARGEA